MKWMEHRPGPLLTFGVAALLVLIWGTTWAAILFSLEGFPPLQGVALRFAVAGLILLGLALATGVKLGRRRYERRLWWVQAVFTFAASYGIVYWAEQWVPSGLVSILFSTFPLWVVIFAVPLLPGERLRGIETLGIVLGFGGVATIFSEDLSALGAPGIAVAAAVALLSPVSSAVGQVVVKRWGEGIHPLSLTAVPMLLCAVLVGALAAVVEADRPMTPTVPSVAALLYLAVVGSAVTFSLYYWLLQHLTATRLALIAYAIPVVAVAVGTLGLDEPLTLRMAVGGLMVVGGVSLAGRRRRQPAAGP